MNIPQKALLIRMPMTNCGCACVSQILLSRRNAIRCMNLNQRLRVYNLHHGQKLHHVLGGAINSVGLSSHLFIFAYNELRWRHRWLWWLVHCKTYSNSRSRGMLLNCTPLPTTVTCRGCAMRTPVVASRSLLAVSCRRGEVRRYITFI